MAVVIVGPPHETGISCVEGVAAAIERCGLLSLSLLPVEHTFYTSLPGTAHGFIFLSIEDESGISNAIIDPELYERNRSLVTHARFLLVEGTLQNVDKVIQI